MISRIKTSLRPPPSKLSNFVPVERLTQFQQDSWYRARPVVLTEGKLEALTAFLIKSLLRRWSLVGPLAQDENAGGAYYVVLLEAETEAPLLEVFRAVADSPASDERRLVRR